MNVAAAATSCRRPPGPGDRAAPVTIEPQASPPKLCTTPTAVSLRTSSGWWRSALRAVHSLSNSMTGRSRTPAETMQLTRFDAATGATAAGGELLLEVATQRACW